MGAKVRSSSGALLDFKDPRFFAGILMSPQGTGVMGLERESWKEVGNPLLTLIAPLDRDFRGQTPEVRADPYRLSKAGYKHLGVIDGATSNSFAGQSADAFPEEAKRFQVIKAITTAYLRAYSSYDEKAFEDMGSDFFRRMSLGVVREQRR
jgi:hypothetical protein